MKGCDVSCFHRLAFFVCSRHLSLIKTIFGKTNFNFILKLLSFQRIFPYFMFKIYLIKLDLPSDLLIFDV